MQYMNFSKFISKKEKEKKKRDLSEKKEVV